MPAIAPPRGTRDLLPDEVPAWRWLHEVHRSVSERHGYRLIDTPVIESTELFARGVGEATDIVDKEMYTFTDRGGRSITLRPEGTAPVVRAVLGARLCERERPVRVHYAMAMFRYDRPQAGRQRQFAQLGVECIGERDPSLDVEVIEVAWRFFSALGVEGVSLQLNSLGDAIDRARYRTQLVRYYMPRRDQLCEDCRRRLEVNPLRLLDCKHDAVHVASAPVIGEALSDESMAYLAAVREGLQRAGVPHSVNQRLVRGLDYYTHTTFEFWHTSLQGAQNALGAGGRYDGLAEQLGFAATPGVGYALGVERILAIAADQGCAPAASGAVGVSVLSATPGDAPEAENLARLLRGHVVAVTDATPRKLDRKLRDAHRRGSRAVLIVGFEEGLVLRDLLTREQTVVGEESLVETVMGWLRAPEKSA